MSSQRPTLPPFGWARPFFTIGITGTNGKTSTTHLLGEMLRRAKGSSLVISTLGFRVGDDVLDLPATAQGFHEAFKIAADRGVRFASVECTSKALSEGYAKRWRFDLAVFTNLSPDHLKTHGTYEHYLASKAQLFVHLGPGRTAVLNAADEHAVMLDHAIPPDVKRVWFAAPSRGQELRPADLFAAKVAVSLAGTEIQLRASPLADALGGRLQVQMVGDVFAENALAAAAAGLAAELPVEAVTEGMRECPPVRGRFEVVSRDPAVVIDYAHTPDALARTCDTARDVATGNVIVVFGAGGESTPQKRAPMGRAVGRRADIAYVTSDNPRREDPGEIAATVAEGVKAGGRAAVHTVLDREEAIERALQGARAGDVVVVAGKGHEIGQTVGTEILAFSDHEVVARLIA